ncbi:glycosyltransferase family 9 protein [Entomobacter blattae]|uniref:Glycosyltransferase family 9 (Heptosyltransferase) n=1 Tax=Entomobacter blattae TaxID=2762277 RepID=A0A7H1NSR5_9PROT|nr:glycosyltransferase family 9 protein [Entomobacter blattae]QNT78825.1 Glycosyltransferase family 9 (heptosyltransferase) [Entomobacter blattae]
MKILFITSTRLGDAVLSTGILNYLAQKYPSAQFTIACGESAQGVFESFPQKDQIYLIIKRKFDFHWVLLWKKCIGQRWDIIVDLRGSVVSFLLRAKKRFIMRGGRRAGPRLQHLGAVFKLVPPPLPVVWTTPKAMEKAEEWVAGYGVIIGLGPTANWEGKIWPAKNFVKLYQTLAHHIGESVTPLVFYGAGPKEYALAQKVIQALPNAIDTGGTLSITEVVALLKKCQIFIGNDSGLMHLSAAARVPTIGLFGPSQVEEYAPSGEWSQAIVAPGKKGEAPIEGLSVEEVAQGVLALMKKTGTIG